MNGWTDAVKLQSASHVLAFGQARHGIVSSVDAINHSVKVMLEPEGVETGWIPDGALASSSLRIACPCEIGTQVLVVAVEGDSEQPMVIARLFDAVVNAPVSPATGQAVQPGEIGIFTQSGSYFHLTQNGLYIGGNVHVSGTLNALGDVTSGSVSLLQHLHTQVQGGSGLSGPPRE